MMKTLTKKYLIAMLAALLGLALGISCIGIFAPRENVSAAGETPITLNISGSNANNLVVNPSEEVDLSGSEKITCYINEKPVERDITYLNANEFAIGIGDIYENEFYTHLRVPAGTVFGGKYVLEEDFHFHKLFNQIDSTWLWEIAAGTGIVPVSEFTFDFINSEGSPSATYWRLPVGYTLHRENYTNFDAIFNNEIIYVLDDLTKADDPQAWDILGEEGNGEYTHLSLDAIKDGVPDETGYFDIYFTALGEGNAQAETGKPLLFKVPAGTVWGGVQGGWCMARDTYFFYNGYKVTDMWYGEEDRSAPATDIALIDSSASTGFDVSTADDNGVPSDSNWTLCSYQTSNTEICRIRGGEKVSVGKAFLKKILPTRYYVDLTGDPAEAGDIIVVGGTFVTAPRDEYKGYYYTLNKAAFLYNGTAWEQVLPQITVKNGEEIVTGDSFAVETNSAVSVITATASDAIDATIADVTVSVTKDGAPYAEATFVNGDYVLTVTATDSEGISATVTKSFTVRDTTPPTITYTGETNLSVNEGTDVPVFGATAQDNIDASVTVVPEWSPADYKDNDNKMKPGVYTVTLTATDAAGNRAEYAQKITVTVRDITAPVITLSQTTYTASVNETAPDFKDIVTVTDNYDTSVGFEAVWPSGALTDGKVNYGDGSWEVTITAKDAAENAAESKTITVTVADITPPVITLGSGVLTTYTLSAGDDAPAITATVTDNSGAAIEPVIVWPQGAKTDEGKLNAGTWQVTVSAADAAGNEAEEIVITVYVTTPDTTDPVITVSGPTEYAAGDELALVFTAVDETDGAVQVSVSYQQGMFDENGKLAAGEWTVTATAKDEAGNDAEKTVTVTVNAPAAPADEGGGCNSGISAAASVLAFAAVAVSVFMFRKKKTE